MVEVRFGERILRCAPGERLRDVLLRASATPHNGQTRWFNCRGLGTCGTCAVQVIGEVSPMSARERARLSFPPHELKAGLRLACQTRVLGDLEVRKHDGFWGHEVEPGSTSA